MKDWFSWSGALLGLFAGGVAEIAASLTPGVRGVGLAVYVAVLFASFMAYEKWVER